MAELRTTKNPPSPHSPRQEMTPANFLSDGQTLGEIKRRSSLNVTPQNPKRLRLEPSSEGILSMEEYMKTQESDAPQQTSIALFGDLGIVRDGVQKEIESRMIKMRQRIENLKEILKDDQLSRLQLLMPNLLVDLAKYAARSLSQAHYCESPSTTTRLLEFYMEGRTATAGDTSGSLARLLLDSAVLRDVYMRFKDLFPVIYGKTIEEKAEENRALWAEVIL
ncbi:MAG: hypothetical protein Q9191_005041 [Dirinaria sp. TL-2023a]